MTRRRGAWIGATLCAEIALAASAQSVAPTQRDDLVGAWHLVAIDVRGPQGAEPDPFYGHGSEGLLIYERTGWFSVQIMSGPRPTLELPAARPELPGGRNASAKEAALDT